MKPAMDEAMIDLGHADTDAEIAACFTVVRQLRPHVTDVAAMVAQVRRQQRQGYRILAARSGTEVLGIAGYRLTENLISGRFVYVDDLAVAEGCQHGGIGAKLLDAVAQEGVAAGCRRLVLDTAVANAQAQRFYFREGLLLVAFHFARPLV